MSKTAVVTGATSGIGAVFARKLAANGFDLILTGRRDDVIIKLARELEAKHSIKAQVILAELSNDADVEKVVKAIKSTNNVEFLVNNAGYVVEPPDFNKFDLEKNERMIKVLTVVPLRLTAAVVPGMIKMGYGSIINVSSIAGLLPASKVAPLYGASKAFHKFWSESSYLMLQKHNIKVQTLCPGFVETDFYRDMDSTTKHNLARFGRQTPEYVVETSLKYLAKNKPMCIPGFINETVAAVIPLLPKPLFYRFANRQVMEQ